MIELASYGRGVSEGEYKVHSRFERAVNCISVDSFVSVVKESVGRGPTNLIFKNLELSQIQSLRVGSDSVWVNDVEYPKSEKRGFSGEIEPIGTRNIDDGLRLFRKLLVSKSSERSLAFLLDEDRKKYFTTSFDKEYVRRCGLAATLVTAGRFVEAAESFRGMGFGLTPSGDDFNCGMLLGLNLIGADEKLLDDVYAAAVGGNPMVNGYLRSGRDGRFFEGAQGLVKSIVGGDREKILEFFYRLVAFGETSGGDLGVGLFLTINRKSNFAEVVIPSERSERRGSPASETSVTVIPSAKRVGDLR